MGQRLEITANVGDDGVSVLLNVYQVLVQRFMHPPSLFSDLPQDESFMKTGGSFLHLRALIDVTM